MCSIDVNELKARLSEPDYLSHDVQKLSKTLEIQPPSNWKLHFAAGMFSGPFSRTTTAPFDRMRLQIQVSPVKQTVPQAWKSLMQNGGIPGLWRGNGVNVFKVGPEMAIRFGTFDKIKQLFTTEGAPLTIYERFMAGATAGIAGQVAIFPIDVLKTRMMIREAGEFNGAFDAIRKIYQREGIRSFYRGYAASAIGIIPYTGVDLTVYETLKNKFIFSKLEPGERPEVWKLLACACTSITCGQFCSYPFYLIKARQQGKSTHESILAIQKGTGCQICKIFMVIIKQDGITGLYRGVLLTLSKVLPAGIVNYMAYEYARRRLTPYF